MVKSTDNSLKQTQRSFWLCVTILLALCCGKCGAQQANLEGLKVDMDPPFARKDILKPHWQSWKWQDGESGSQTFGNVTVTFRAESGDEIGHAWYKGLLVYGAQMAAEGIIVKEPTGSGRIEMVISGLTPGSHTVVTYHNEVRNITPGKLDVYVDGTAIIKGLVPTQRARDDYDVRSTFLEINAVAGQDVVISFRPDGDDSPAGCIINGFEIDTVDPQKKAIKPSPQHDDEHVPTEAVLTWTAPESAISHDLYLGPDYEKVAAADRSSAEFKGNLTQPSYPIPPLDHMKTYFWRVDEVLGGRAVPVKGEIWRFRVRFPAFPTAEGYGRFARGGRGGRVIEVTNLLDYDPANAELPIPGSYRSAIEASGPRTVVFRVSGLIRLKASCPIRNPYITIAGQTAPGDGICLSNYSAGLFGCHDAIIRYVRCRVGDHSRKSMDGMGMGAGSDHSIIDHCSISWTLDEGTSSRGGKNITFQRNIVSEALHHSYHYNGRDRTKYAPHAFAASISGDIGSFHHNLLAHCTDRNWSLAGGYNNAGQYDGFLDIRNNVVYNWIKRTTDGGVMRCNYVNNYYKPCPENQYVKWLLKLDPINKGAGIPKYYMAGNVMEGVDYEQDNWKAFYNGPEVESLVRVDEPLFESYVTTHTAAEALASVLDDVGANFPGQDAIDRRIIEEVRTGTVHYTGTKGASYDPPGRNYPGIIDTQDDVKDCPESPNFPWPEYRTYDVPTDTDHDGMPDRWEKQAGLDPQNTGDGNDDRDGDGYTNLEEYLGWLVGEFPDPQPIPDAMFVLYADSFRHHVDFFNRMEPENIVNHIPNVRSWQWLKDNVPFFECPDKDFEQIYYYRWWTLRKHIKKTPDGFVFTEFLDEIGHSGKYNTISCALGHHIYEGTWLRDNRYIDEYASFWYTGHEGGLQPHFHKYSNWGTWALYRRYLVNQDKEFLLGLLDAFIRDYETWVKEHGMDNGLLWQYDTRDGMEESISGSRRETNSRPPLNSYMYAGAVAISKVAQMAGRQELSHEYARKAAKLKSLIHELTWDEEASFFKVRYPDGRLAGVREELGYIPWYFNIPKQGCEQAWLQLVDPQGFKAPMGITTAERRHPDFRSHGVGTCEWDGAVWPYATSQTLVALANLLRNYEQDYVTRQDYFDALMTYARSHRYEGRPYIGEYLDEKDGTWLKPDADRSRYYNHSTFCDLVIGGLVGLIPQEDNTVLVEPLLPADTWDWFCLDGVPYHGRTLTILWDRTGDRYDRGKGFRIFADGTEIVASDSLKRIIGKLP